MPSRKNRPGKCGTPPLVEVERAQEDALLAEVTKYLEARERGQVWWAKPEQESVAERLAKRGLLRPGFVAGCYRLARPR